MSDPVPAIPELTIIIVNWNTRDMTAACLASLYAETRATAFEVILVDNGSHDGSAASIAAAYPAVRLLAEQCNHGFAVANNIAAKQARGRRLLLLNSDTLVLDGAIDRLFAFAQSRPAAGIWGGRTVFADGSLNPTCCWRAMSLWSTFCFVAGLSLLFRASSFFYPEGMGGWQRDCEREVDIVSGCFLMIDTSLWNRLDGFDPAFFMYGEEADLCARARAAGARPVMTPEATIVHYGGASARARSDHIVQLFRGKIGLARRFMGPAKAAMVRWLFMAAVVMRMIAYGALAKLRPAREPQARQWRETFTRRAEWFARASLIR